MRKRNAGRLTATAFRQAMTDFDAEICQAKAVRKIVVDERLAVDGFGLIDVHSVNGSDAIVLRSAIDSAVALRAVGDDLLLVASDVRLLRAAQAEGLATFNPEIQSPADLDALLGP